MNESDRLEQLDESLPSDASGLSDVEPVKSTIATEKAKTRAKARAEAQVQVKAQAMEDSKTDSNLSSSAHDIEVDVENSIDGVSEQDMSQPSILSPTSSARRHLRQPASSSSSSERNETRDDDDDDDNDNDQDQNHDLDLDLDHAKQTTSPPPVTTTASTTTISSYQNNRRSRTKARSNLQARLQQLSVAAAKWTQAAEQDEDEDEDEETEGKFEIETETETVAENKGRWKEINDALRKLETLVIDQDHDHGHGHGHDQGGDGNDLAWRTTGIKIEDVGIDNGPDDQEVGGRVHDDHDGNNDDDYISEQDLYRVHDSLLSTMQQMRLRSQEQRHLHSLTVRKLGLVAQRCFAQSGQIALLGSSLLDEQTRATDTRAACDGLARENHLLGAENDELRSRKDEMQALIRALEAEVQRQAIALTAMNSAVTGLEEWMNYSSTDNPNRSATSRSPGGSWSNGFQPNRYTSPPKSGHRFANGRSDSNSVMTPRTRTVVRGKGRFRGRYQVDVDDDGGDEYNDEYFQNVDRGRASGARSPSYFHRIPAANGTVVDYPNQNTAELQDDVRAWIRGCRDVLECAQAGADAFRTALNPNTPLEAPGLNGVHQADTHTTHVGDNDEGDWGEFQTAQASG